MFDKLSEKITSSLNRLTGRGSRLTEAVIQESLREVRQALLEADVNYKVVKSFLQKVESRISVLDTITTNTPGQHVVKVVHEELSELMGSAHQELDFSGPPPHVLMMVGLQGSGKTTTAAKLALYLKKQGRRPYLVPADVARPAAVHQLTVLAGEAGSPVYAPKEGQSPLEIVDSALVEAAKMNCDCVFIDTAGRLTIDAPLMTELSQIKKRARPREILLVADSMTGQEAVTIARDFNERLSLTGVILTKMEGDARAGAAMSMRAAVGKPLKFIGTGEKLDAIEPFHPDRTASLILGMGDVLTLIEKAREHMDQEVAAAYVGKMQKGQFTLEDLRNQLRSLKKVGTVRNLLGMIPGLGKLKKLTESQPADSDMKIIEVIIDSMTPEERVHSEIVDASRRRRIARGSGRSVQDVNNLLRNFTQVKHLLRSVSNSGNFNINAIRHFLPR
ncbi:MAG: signal recognition particle protein [Deltaproteobacteria bacterium]|nr:signal recognition particle protein [Deltaproteobacteria bacterium]